MFFCCSWAWCRSVKSARVGNQTSNVCMVLSITKYWIIYISVSIWLAAFHWDRMGKIWLFSLVGWHSCFLPSGSAVSTHSLTRVSCSERKNHEGTGNKKWTGSISSFHWYVVSILFKSHIKQFYTCSSCNPIWLCGTLSMSCSHWLLYSWT